MNGEKHPLEESQVTYLEKVRNPALRFSAAHASDKAVVEAVYGALEQEGVLAEYEDLFIEAQSIEAGLTEVFNQLLSEKVAHSFTRIHKDSLESVKVDANRYRVLTQKLVEILGTHGYEVSVDEVPLPEETQDEKVVEESVSVIETPLEVSVLPEVAPEVVVVPEATPKSVVDESVEETTETQVGSENVSEIAKLTELYKMASTDAFKINLNQERSQFKNLKVIKKEIKAVLRAARFNNERVQRFLSESVNRHATEIHRFNFWRNEEIDPIQKKEVSSRITDAYQQLLNDVSAFLQTEKVDEAQEVLNAELPVEGVGNFDDALSGALSEFELFKVSGSYEENPLYIKAAGIIAQLEAYSETDPVRAANDKERYLRTLLKTLNKLRLEGDEVTLDASEVASLKPVFENPVVTLTDIVETPTEVNPLSEVPVPVELGTVKETGPEPLKKHEILSGAKNEYKEKGEAYKVALSEYYEQQKSNNSLRARVGATLRKISGLGVSPELPPELMKMQSEYKELRANYLGLFNEALIARSSREGNKDISLNTDGTKIAFGKKFILKPNQEMLAMQETSVLSPKMQAVMSSVMANMAKHKWATRIGIVTAAGIAGALSGGTVLALAGASHQASKMLVSGVVGAGAGYGAKRLTQRGVDKAEGAFADKSKEFTLADLDTFEEELLNAQSAVSSAKTKQKVATITAGVLAGGATGYGLASVDMDRFVPGQSNTLSDEAVQRIVAGELAAEAEAARPTPVYIDPAPATPEPAAVQEAVETVEAIPDIQMGTLTYPYYGESGERMFETILKDVKIEGAFTDGALPDEVRLELERYIKLSFDGALHSQVNINEARLEAETLAKVQAKFGSAPWYNAAGITKIDIGSMSKEEYFMNPSTSPVEVIESQEGSANIIETTIGDQGSIYAEAAPVSERVVGEANRVTINVDGAERIYTESRPTVAVTETQTVDTNRVASNVEGAQSSYNEARPVATTETTATSPERVAGSYLVQKGDTLSEITEKKFAGLLKDIPESKRGLLLEELFNNVQADSTLRDSLGMRSGDVDLIYPNEKLNLDGVEAELSRLVEREKTLDLFRTSGPLTVEADVEVKNVPITVPEKPETLSTAPITTAEATAAATTAASANFLANRATQNRAENTTPITKEVIPPPRPFALNGQFAQTPAYKDYLRKTIGTEKALDQVIERAVKNYDKTTYDVFSIFGESFESPYTFLGDMTLKEVALFEAKPNAEVRSFLKENNIKYETYLAWLDKIDEMVEALPNQNETKVSDLFTRYVAETQVPKANSLIK